VKVWDARSGQQVLTLKGHIEAVTEVCFSPDGKRLASGSAGHDLLRDKTWGEVKVWDARSGQQVLTLKGHTEAVTSVCFSPNGKHIAVTSYDNLDSMPGKVKVWDARPWTPDSQVEVAARSVVKFLVQRLGLRSEVIRRLEQGDWLRPEVRVRAREMASHLAENPSLLNAASWGVVARPNAAVESYALALRQAEAACRLESDYGVYLNTLGVAQYRLGKYQEALDTLTRSDKLNSVSGRQLADVSFLAMANFKLGQKEKAEAFLVQLRQLMKQPAWPGNAEAQGFVREAEELLAGKR